MSLPDLPYNELIEFETVDRITPVGMTEVRDMLRRHNRDIYIPEWFDPRWNTNQRDPKAMRAFYNKKEDKITQVPVVYRGKFVGRVEQLVRTQLDCRLSPDIKKQLGAIAANHVLKSNKVLMDFTKRINWSAGDFGDGGSCFWGEYAYARIMMREANFAAVRLYDPNEVKSASYPFRTGLGRGWLGYDPDNQCDLVVFNGYLREGSWTRYSHTNDTTMLIAQLTAQYLDLSYKMVNLSNHGTASDILYINGCRGVILGDSRKIRNVEEVDFQLDTDDYVICDTCDRSVHRSGYVNYNGNCYCDSCVRDYLFHCDSCYQYYSQNEKSYTHHSRLFCQDCYESNTVECGCPDCDARVWLDEAWSNMGQRVCNEHRHAGIFDSAADTGQVRIGWYW